MTGQRPSFVHRTSMLPGFWLLYILGWMLFAAAFAAIHITTGSQSVSGALGISLLIVAPAAALGVVVLSLSHAISVRVDSLPAQVGIHAIGMLVFPLAWILIIWSARTALNYATTGDLGLAPPPERVMHWHILSGSIAYAFLVAVYHLMRQHEARERLRVEGEIRTALARFSPHFLFNTLTALQDLIRTDVKRAEFAHGQLAMLLGEAVRSEHGRCHSLERELGLLRAYLELQDLRFGERLEFRETIEPSALGEEVPAHILQPLAENAIRHGIERLPSGGRLAIDASVDGEVLILSLANPVPPIAAEDDQEGSSFGLHFVEMQLKHFDPAAELVTTNDGSQFVAVIRIPIEETEP